MLDTQPITTTYQPTAQELLLAIENTRYLYNAARIRRDEAWHLYEEAIDDGDREAIHDLLGIAELAALDVAESYRDMEAAYAAYWAKVN